MTDMATMDVVETSHGRLSGVARGGHLAFYGIPYAKAARFDAPEPADPWSGVREAVMIGLAAPQTEHYIAGFAASGPQGEACQNLNVFTPAIDGRKRPVLVWIHGGGFTHGAGYEPLYDGGALAERGDVVVVTLNYRLGVLGFLRLPEIGAEGDQGLLDQNAALTWVAQNIAAFGGDPDNVTIFGESAGSASVGCQLAMPASRGLFKRAVMQSGVGRASAPEVADAAADKLLAELGLSRARAAELRDLPVETILAAQAAAQGRLAFGFGFQPSRNPDILPLDPTASVREGKAADRAILIGWNRDEVKLFNATQPRETPDEAQLLAAIRGVLPKVSEAEARDVIAVYRASRDVKGLRCDPLDILDAISTDAMFRIPSQRLCLAQREKGGTAFLYFFTHASPAMRGALGACHALEMPFVFGTLKAPTQDRFAGAGEDVERLSRDMMDAWIAYARTGDPSHQGIGPWVPYDADRRPTMVFGTGASGQMDDPFAEERQALEGLI